MDTTLQHRLHLWRQKNFPDANEEQQFLGIVEEVGELAHVRLKGIQGIRGYDVEPHRLCGEEDAVGDILIYLMGFCSYKDWDMMKILEEVSKDVMRRDWIKYPKDGLTPYSVHPPGGPA